MMMSLKKSKGTHKMGGNMYTSAANVETTTSATRRSQSTRKRREWSEQLDGSSGKYM
jgi:hypothetical protein